MGRTMWNFSKGCRSLARREEQSANVRRTIVMWGCAQAFALMLLATNLFLFQAAEAAHHEEVLAPAPAPAPPAFENMTQSLVFGGNYFSFINLLEETKVDVIFQGIANDTEGPGITVFAPTDDAFKSNKLVSSLLKNLTASQKVTLAEYHALNVYQAFKNLQNSNNNVTSTFATFNSPAGAGKYQVNITFTGGGRLQIVSGWTTAKISTTVYSKKPVSIFAIDQVLIPDEIFGLPPPPPPAAPPPAQAPSPSPSSAPLSITRPSSKEPSSTTSLSLSPILRSALLLSTAYILFYPTSAATSL